MKKDSICEEVMAVEVSAKISFVKINLNQVHDHKLNLYTMLLVELLFFRLFF